MKNRITMGVFKIEPFNFVTENDNVKNKDEYKNDLDDLYKNFTLPHRLIITAILAKRPEN